MPRRNTKKITQEGVNNLNAILDNAYPPEIWIERPVTMRRFLLDPHYMGKSTTEGKFIHPIWVKSLVELSNLPEKYICALTGAIGIGKTTAAVWGVTYVMHLILCLKSPWDFFEKNDGGKMAVVFFNLTKTLSGVKAYNLLQKYMTDSPWFKARGWITGNDNAPKLNFKLFDFISASPYSKGFGSLGQNIIAGIMDEVDSPKESHKQRERVLSAFKSNLLRFENRFVLDSEVSGKKLTLGKFFIVASKQEKLSFLTAYIAKMKNSPNLYIVDVPIWEAKGNHKYCGRRFPVILGDAYITSSVGGEWIGDYNDITKGKFKRDEEMIAKALGNGREIIDVPVEFVQAFTRDPIGSLRDYAGVSVTSLRKTKLFPSEKLLYDAYDKEKQNPITMSPIVIGLKDDIDLCRFIDFDKIRMPRSTPRYVHVDIAYSGDGDCMGIGMSGVCGWTTRTVEDLDEGGTMRAEKVACVETDFGMRITAPPGDRVPLFRVRQMIINLKKKYRFNIALVTFDLNLLSEESKQILERAGMACGALSLDRKPDVYRNFRSFVTEGRWVCHLDPYLHFELANLEDDPELNRVDHPDDVPEIVILEDGNAEEVITKGTKDMSDGVVGSVEGALSHSDKAPPDKEFIRAVQVATKAPVPGAVDHSLFDQRNISNPNDKPKPDPVPPTPNARFKDIFKRSQKK